jgi:hypothetical protein
MVPSAPSTSRAIPLECDGSIDVVASLAGRSRFPVVDVSMTSANAPVI